MTGKFFEVERKYRISTGEFEEMPARLSKHGFQSLGKVTMTDTFLPTAEKDALLRLRKECSGNKTKNILTAKVWVHWPDGQKERQEHEEELGELASQAVLDLGKAAAKSELISYSKDRALYQGVIDGWKIVVSLDSVEGLGEYSGHYMEVEILVEADEKTEAARNQVFQFAHKLLGDERDFESLSYKSMLERTLQRAGV